MIEAGELEERLARHQTFWGPKFGGEGPYFAVASPLPQFRSDSDRLEKWLDLDYRLEVIEESFESAFFLGDAIPRIDPDFGPTFLPAILGRPYRVGEETVWCDVEPFENAEEIYGLSLKRDGTYYRTFMELTECLCERSEGHYLVGVADVGSEADILASLYSRESLLMDMALEPEKVGRLLSRVGELWEEATLANEKVVRRYQGYTITWVPVANEKPWSPLLSEISAMVSTRMFKEIITPSVWRMSRIFDQILFNVDGDSYIRHLPEVLKLDKLHSIEWDPNPKYSADGKLEKDFTTPESIAVIRDILEQKKVVFNRIPAWQVPYLMERIPHDGVFFYLEFSSPGEAKDFLDMAGKWLA
ncbi:MAG: hypothetical protein LBS93_08375 [Synergistaceae bacterium]|jgi:hypothetical protein|nr:hypothetical protein [Synergistaceae bacterium]